MFFYFEISGPLEGPEGLAYIYEMVILFFFSSIYDLITNLEINEILDQFLSISLNQWYHNQPLGLEGLPLSPK